MNYDRRKDVDSLIEHFWKRGYLTVSRKYGTYLPEPDKVGIYDIDVVARYKDSYAIGIILNDEDFFDLNKTINKIIYLSTRQTKYNGKKVALFIGVSLKNYKTAKAIVDEIPEDVRKNIRLVQIIDRQNVETSDRRRNNKIIFS
ncbi:MAG: hypothetical protein JETCAE03_37130 [Ignavibacteriaceae bacterium]|jgi:hypothetical protein|uniref:hypothetical protein n=1 Tax=Ignavibacterium TaxID=795750 RepID=UPI002083789C|nr:MULTISPECIES: hypothetical protein [Ignavibacterium]MBI5661967.1 hypothetical protein [Ignavibacterium album]GJQ44215.1 MAG: hypothetical protein JETCAE03_37130 [Ignavibacteriaceae bacterium]